MKNYRIKPTANYIKEANWEELYILIEHWKNDIAFYLFDIKFLETLIESHFSELLEYENLDELRELQLEIFELKNQCEYIQQRIQLNLDNIVKIIDKTYKHNTAEFRIENEQLEDDIISLINNEREVKNVVFRMIKEILENEKSKKTWMFN
ncbi:hypothetical protein [Algibacter sp. L4_22]|uniref:hypothetical protein n=1 Tax=Algibacter sp. L4_22 TaxID=2942477 RepID=UPI00201B7EE1|nr:hypothetical protein [Algibacter sp. L4_22]MCL5128275.1 hypothetical protein [Algibacter sp. L4_22]